MKKVLKNKIINREDTDKFDSIFEFDVLQWAKNQDVKIIFLSDLLEKKKNLEMLEKAENKPASYSNVYSPQDELDIFKNLFEKALENNQKIHIVGVSLKEEMEILEKYYWEQWFFNKEINCFDVDFWNILVSVSVKIENIMWRGSDYKRMWKKIFFNPPVRESGQVKAMFKWINRGVTAGLYLWWEIGEEVHKFLSQQVLEEKILPITLWKILQYNLDELGIKWEIGQMHIKF